MLQETPGTLLLVGVEGALYVYSPCNNPLSWDIIASVIPYSNFGYTRCPTNHNRLVSVFRLSFRSPKRKSTQDLETPNQLLETGTKPWDVAPNPHPTRSYNIVKAILLVYFTLFFSPCMIHYTSTLTTTYSQTHRSYTSSVSNTILAIRYSTLKRYLMILICSRSRPMSWPTPRWPVTAGSSRAPGESRWPPPASTPPPFRPWRPWRCLRKLGKSWGNMGGCGQNRWASWRVSATCGKCGDWSGISGIFCRIEPDLSGTKDIRGVSVWQGIKTVSMDHVQHV